jgi:hypothetical protein
MPGGTGCVLDVDRVVRIQRRLPRGQAGPVAVVVEQRVPLVAAD